MKCDKKSNPYLAAGLLMELMYLCTDHLAPMERALGSAGSFLCGVWHGAAVALLLAGLMARSPQGREWLNKLCVWKKS